MGELVVPEDLHKVAPETILRPQVCLKGMKTKREFYLKN